jgi:hypothetical protein
MDIWEGASKRSISFIFLIDETHSQQELRRLHPARLQLEREVQRYRLR